ncbi:TIR domain-containing protein [Persicitalea jodogahamensis]|uniref:Thoeris protein ThsB TIR-like domain-containing protein n=1 Tax=Persicitalea jodogahamensis TaxID=402147 RepID=A0A8J3DDR0_9BACT|nr:TIR domain-containing protein [Persicitalea jodogahamensis]GHB87816.1 hypothetical protein GCM10007390_49910 [Persicitalea jodogahamensis]
MYPYISKRKLFVSYYHKDDQYYRNLFDHNFGDLFINKSVGDGEINSENGADYVRQLIHKGYLSDTTVLVVLVGEKTKCRKHVDWEISGALDYRVGNRYAGLIGILLPTHPDFGKSVYSPGNLPERLALNVDSDYAKLIDWTDDRSTMQRIVEDTVRRRESDEGKIVNRFLLQMTNNTCS